MKTLPQTLPSRRAILSPLGRKFLPRVARKSPLRSGFFSIVALLFLCVSAPAALVEKWSVVLPGEPDPAGYPEGTFRVTGGQIVADGSGGVVVTYVCRESDTRPVPLVYKTVWLDAAGNTIFSYTAPEDQLPSVVGVSPKNLLLSLNDPGRSIMSVNRNGVVDSVDSLEGSIDSAFVNLTVYFDGTFFFAYRYNSDRSQISIVKFRANNQAP